MAAANIPLKKTVQWLAVLVPTGAATGYVIASLAGQFFALQLGNGIYHFVATAAVAAPLLNFYARLFAYGSELVQLPEAGRVGRPILAGKRSPVTWTAGNRSGKLFLSTARTIFSGAHYPSEMPAEVQKFAWPVRVPLRKNKAVVLKFHLRENLVEEFLRRVWRRQMRGEKHPLSGNYFVGKWFKSTGRYLEPHDYDGIIILLRQYRLITETRRQGTSGKLDVPTWVEAMQILRNEAPIQV